MHITKLDESSSQQQLDERVDEIELAEFVKLLKDNFAIFSEPARNRPSVVRLIGSPYNATNPECLSMQITAHARGTRVSPLVIYAVLRKFDIGTAAYNEAVAGQQKLIPTRPHLIKTEAS